MAALSHSGHWTESLHCWVILFTLLHSSNRHGGFCSIRISAQTPPSPRSLLQPTHQNPTRHCMLSMLHVGFLQGLHTKLCVCSFVFSLDQENVSSTREGKVWIFPTSVTLNTNHENFIAEVLNILTEKNHRINGRVGEIY